MFTLDRLTALYFPIFYREHSKPYIAVCLSILAEQMAALICWPTLFFFDINGKFCEIFNFDYFTEEQMILFANIAMFLFMLTVPFVTILVSNLLIILKLRASSKGEKTSLQKKEREITMQLLTVCTAFMLTNIGVSVCVYITTIMDVTTPQAFAIRDFINFLKVISAILSIVVSEKNVALKILFFLQIKSKQRTDFLTEQQNDISSLDLL